MYVKIENIYSIDYGDTPKVDNPVEVFHGTTGGNHLSIFKSGLKVSPPSSAYVSGKMFGNGVYGAVNSTKSLGYCFGRWGGSKDSTGWLYICDFHMGKVYNPKHTIQRPPTGYDSIWARSNDCGLAHDELIVFQNERIKLKYLIECK